MSPRTRLCCLCLALLAVISANTANAAAAERNPYIVVFKDSVTAPGALARSQAQQHHGELGFVYRYALKGYSAELPDAAVQALERNPNVDYVSPDGTVEPFEEEIELETEENEGAEIFEATIPTGISRTFAAGNKALDIDNQDDIRANVDVAVLDTGISQTHPDLNVVARTNCTLGGETCTNNNGTDVYSHGTHVAGTIGAIDNGYGVVGMAPGARLWAVKVLGDSGTGSWSWVIAGVDWVTAHASEIEVANMSLGGPPTTTAVENAIEKSIEAGVVYTVAAGNSNTTAEKFMPARFKPAITVSSIADYDGKSGGKSSPTCANYGLDDQRASFSNYGPIIDIAAPGVCILSTSPSSSYSTKSGTSMASPHVAGAAALLAAKNNPNSKKDVEALAATLKETGNYGWTDTSGDGVKEPLLDVSNESIYSIVSAPVVTTGASTYVGVGASTETFLTGTVNPKGLSTTYQFEYVEAAKYKPEAENPYAEGSKVPASPATLSGTVDQEYEVKEKITGLKAGTTYHYRLVAENSKGASPGGDQTVTGLAACKGKEGQCEWSLQTTVNPEAEKKSELEDVSCPSSTMCMAVGNDRYRGTGFAEYWNGSSWKMASSFSGEMKAVSCPTTTWCMTVAKTDAKGWQLKWVEIFSGSWQQTAKSPPTPEGASDIHLNDVSCTSESACTAVGRYYASGSYKPYVARWNGSEWSLQTAASPSEGDASEALLSVSCASSSFCMAVGKAAGKPFAERWNGSEWTGISTANPGGVASLLEGVSCTSSSFCMAVGSYEESNGVDKTLAERWNGSNWTISTTANPAKEGHAELRGVSCASTSSCIAAGSFSNLFVTEETTLAESWNGTSWTLQTSPNPEGNLYSSLAAVSCSSSVACTAVGKSRPKIGEADTLTLAERWNGEKWSLQTTVNPEAEKKNQLEDVSCPSSTMCMAVGNDRYRERGFAEYWNGSSWKMASSFSGEMKAVSCPTTTWCMTVARSGAKGWQLKWVEILSGSWQQTEKYPPTPEGGTEVQLNDVSCTSESACTAVGRYYASGSYKPYVARWNGSEWSLQTAASPSEGDASEALLSVSCASSSFCMAVGKAAKKPFAESWNGSEWAVVSVPNPESATSASLESISCPLTTACMAVGSYQGSSGPSKTLAERWNGSNWTISTTANPAKEGHSRLKGVSCLSAGSCIAVGSWSTTFVTEETTLAESWNGTSWTLQTSPNPEGNLYSSLAAVSCSSSVACTAVGSSRPKMSEADTLTLAERWD